MKMVINMGVLLVLACALLVGCAGMQSQTQPKPAEAAFTPKPLQTTCYDQKTNNFLVLLDASGSMGEKYKGQTKYKIAEQVVSRMNQTIPGGMTLNAAVRTFGGGFSSDTAKTYGPESYSKSGLDASLGKVNYGGCSTVVIEGTTLHQCGGTYYQPYNNQYVVVYVD